MASAARSCAVVRFATDEVAPPETIHVMHLQRLRLRHVCVCDSDADDAQVPAGSPSAHNSSNMRRSAVLAASLQ
uniref:Uncharacterized protein n=1 Tax=Aegilops tauschii subsp. strangulata TaxID=200361 RepID=A0A453Q6R6_AEGTS